MAKPAPTLALVPGRRRSAQISTEVLSAIATSLDRFVDSLGGRPALIAALSVTDLSPEVAAIVSIVGDPENDAKSLAAICAESRIAPAEILAAYKSAIIARSQLLALTTITDAAPGVVKDLAARAVEHQAICLDCHGRGTISEERLDKKAGEWKVQKKTCLACDGVGTIRRMADPQAQDRILDMTGLLPKAGPGIALGVHIQNGSAGGAVEGKLEQLQGAVGQILARTKITSAARPPLASSSPPIQEAEIVPSQIAEPE